MKIRNWYGKVIGYKSADYDDCRRKEFDRDNAISKMENLYIEKFIKGEMGMRVYLELLNDLNELKYNKPIKDYLNNNTMKSPEQKIKELEEKFNKELEELKIQLKQRTLDCDTIIENSIKGKCSMVDVNMIRKYKLTAIRDMIAVADYLNDGWVPNFINNQAKPKYCIFIDEINKIQITDLVNNYCICYFKSKDIAEQAIEILGAERIKLALS